MQSTCLDTCQITLQACTTAEDNGCGVAEQTKLLQCGRWAYKLNCIHAE